MSEKQDIHLQADKKLVSKAKEVSNFTHKELYEFGCQMAIEKYSNPLDKEILELNKCIEKVGELESSIRKRLELKEVPTPPDHFIINDNNENDDTFKRNILPLDFFKEIVLYYMDDFNITDINELSNKNKQIFAFILINLSYHELSAEDINELYSEVNSE